MKKENKTVALVNIAIKGFVLGEMKPEDSIQKLNELLTLKNKTNTMYCFFINKKNERISEYDILSAEYPIRLIALPHSDDVNKLFEESFIDNTVIL